MALPFKPDPLRIRHALKTGIACLLGWIVMHLLPPGNGQWILVTIIVVMAAQLNLGSLVDKATMRFLGTLCGAATALLTLLVFQGSPVAHLAVILLSTIGFTYIAGNPAAIGALGPLGAVTVIIILTGHPPSIVMGLHRLLEIAAGILISLAVSVLIFPLHADVLLQKKLSSLLQDLQALYRLLPDASFLPDKKTVFFEREELFRKEMADFRKLRRDAMKEPGPKRFSADTLGQTEKNLREVLRGILHMQRSLAGLPSETVQLLQTGSFQNMHTDILNLFAWLVSVTQKTKNFPCQTVTEAEKCSVTQDSEMTQALSALSHELRKPWYALQAATSQVAEGLSALARLL